MPKTHQTLAVLFSKGPGGLEVSKAGLKNKVYGSGPNKCPDNPGLQHPSEPLPLLLDSLGLACQDTCSKDMTVSEAQDQGAAGVPPPAASLLTVYAATSMCVS